MAEVDVTALYLLSFMFAQAAAVIFWMVGEWGSLVFVIIFNSQGVAAGLP